MSRRYIWAGEIIDTWDGGVNLDDEEIVGRLNGLDQENTNLDAELTETLMAVADLMDENADLSRQLAEAYERCAHICNRLADESSTTFVRAMSESIEENKMRIARMQGLKTAEEEIRALIPKEETGE